MSLRLRLAAWCVAIFCVLLAMLAIVLYGIHSRAHYQDLDRTLAAVTAHFKSEIETKLSPGAQLRPNLLASLDTSGSQLVGIDIALFDATGALIGGRPVAGAHPDRLTIGDGGHSDETFETVQTEDERVRIHIMPLMTNGTTLGYIESSVPMRALDRSIERFRLLLIAAIVIGLLVAAVGSLMTATRALRPLADMTETARAIALSRGFGRRLQSVHQADELGELARTFNEMLSSLDAAYQAQRRFVDDAAHELRAPITSIDGNLDLLDRAHDLPVGERAAIVSDLRAETHRLGRLVNDLLALARADSGQPVSRTTVELDRVVVDAVSVMRRQAANVVLEVASLEPVIVSGDPDRLRQVLIILLENAIRYTPSGGRVWVSLRHQAQEALLEVGDTGVGIGAAEIPHVFDRFYRADSARSRVAGGSGLGLAIAKWIAGAHDGRIEVESELGQGTVFRICLPLTQARPPKPGQG